MSTEKKSASFVLLLILFTFTHCCIMLAGQYSGAAAERRKAIEANAGRWVLVDEKTGETKWEWTGRVP